MPGFSHRGIVGANDVPEPGRVVAFDQVSKLVDDHIVDHEHWRLDKTPVEIEVVVHCTRAPAVGLWGGGFYRTTTHALRPPPAASEAVSGAWMMIERSLSTVIVSFFRFGERTILYSNSIRRRKG